MKFHLTVLEFKHVDVPADGHAWYPLYKSTLCTSFREGIVLNLRATFKHEITEYSMGAENIVSSIS
jgi:hypothetical protein